MPANWSTSSSVLTSSMRPGPALRMRTSSPGAKPASRITSAGMVIWFFRDTTLMCFTLSACGKGPGTAGATVLWIGGPPCAPGRSAAVVELLLPVARAACGREVEQVPERLDRAGVARILAGIGGRVEELGAPE